MTPGDVVHIWLEKEQVGGKAGKFKFLIRVDAKERWFLAINSDQRRVTPEDNMPLTHTEAEFLPKEVSYVDTSRLIGLSYAEWRDGMAKPGAKPVGRLSDKCIAKLLACVAKSKVLIKWQKAMIARNLSPGTAPKKS
jgi:hypothetical protein